MAKQLTVDEKKLLVQEIDSALTETILNTTEINELLELARQYGIFQWTNKTGTWGVPELENSIYNMLQPHLPPFWPAKERNHISHVISEAYEIGGHTPLCVSLMREQRKRGEEVQLVVTRSAAAKVIEEVKKADVNVINPEFTGLAKLFFLVQTFLQSKVVVLHIHPDDIIACLAAMIAERAGVRCHFVNHAETHFSYGPSQCSSVLEINAFSWLSTKQFRNPQAQSFLGIPCGEIEIVKATAEKQSESLEPYFISVGSRNKFRLHQTSIFSDFVEILCGDLDQKLRLIAPLSDTDFKNLSQKARSNLELLGTKDPVTTLSLMADAKAYIDSFPEGGGTSVTNAMRLGLPTFGCRPSGGLYGDECLSDTLEALVDEIRRFLKDGVDSEMLSSRAEFIAENFSIGACVDRLELALAGETVDIPFSFDENALDLYYYQDQWLDNGSLYIPPIVEISNE